MDHYKNINHNRNDYTVFPVTYKNTKLPVIVDYDDFTKIKKFNKIWKYSIIISIVIYNDPYKI